MQGEIHVEERGTSGVLWIQGVSHKYYEDRYRLLCRPVPLVAARQIGEVIAVADGVGSAPRGMSAAQYLCDSLVRLYDLERCKGGVIEALANLMDEANRHVNGWGMIPDTDRPLGACAATIIHVDQEQKVANVFHAGDTRAALVRDGVAQILTPLDQADDGSLLHYFGLVSLKVRQASIALEEGDRLLLVSDGITKLLTIAEVANLIERHPTRAASLGALGAACLRRGCPDDATAVLFDVEGD